MGDRTGVEKSTWFDGKEESYLAHRLFGALRYHVRTQQLLSTRRAKQRTIIWVAVVVILLSVLAAVTQ